MKPRRPFRAGRGQFLAPTILRIYLLAGVVVLAVGFLLYFQSLTRRVERQTEAMSDVLARFVGVAATTVPALPDSAGALDYSEVVRLLDFPVILSDLDGRPMTWNEGQVGVKSVPLDTLIAMDLENPSPEVARVLALMERLRRRHQPLPFSEPGSEEVFGYIYYGSPALTEELRWVPVATILIAALFGFTALMSLRSIKRAEQGFIWAGMAKESAHQMGTPISSLMGWVEVLRGEVREDDTEAHMPRDLYHEVVREIEQDAERLNRVAARFSQIGSQPKLTTDSIVPVVMSTVEYFRTRLPRQGSRVELDLEVESDLPQVMLNRELMGWVLENLIKNAMDAADKAEGRVSVSVTARTKGMVAVVVRDNGRGVASGMEGQIFRPGVSTRQRGWGLGLPLSRRIVAEYHGGRLDLTWSDPGKGAEFTVLLPRAALD